MAREAETKEINGSTWTAQPWPGMYGLKMQARIAKLVGPALEGVGGMDDMMNADAGAMASKIAGGMDEAPTLIMEMMHGTLINNVDANKCFDQHFSGNFAELYEGIAFILRVNFGDFGRLVGAIGGLVPPAEKPKAK